MQSTHEFKLTGNYNHDMNQVIEQRLHFKFYEPEFADEFEKDFLKTYEFNPRYARNLACYLLERKLPEEWHNKMVAEHIANPSNFTTSYFEFLRELKIDQE